MGERRGEDVGARKARRRCRCRGRRQQQEYRRRGKKVLRKKVPYFSTICNKKIFNIYNHIALYLFAYIRGTILFIKIVFLIVQFNPKGLKFRRTVMNTATERIMKTKEKIAKLKEQIRRKAATAGIILAASATMASCSPKQAQQSEENTDKQEQLSAQGEQKHDEATASFEDARWREACLAEQVEEYKQMIADGADLDKINPQQRGMSVLFGAVEWDNIKGAELLLKAGANPNLSMEGGQGETPVFYATSLEMVKLLEKYGADLNYKNKMGKQPLFAVCLTGGSDGKRWNEDIATYLIEKGNSISNLDHTYGSFTPDKFKFYQDKGVKLDIQKMLEVMVDRNNPEMVRLMLANGGKKYVNSIYPDEPRTPLLDATMGAARASGDELEKSHEIIRLLIDNGADIHKKSGSSTPLETAHEMQDEKLAEFLQKCTAERTAKTQAMQAVRAR